MSEDYVPKIGNRMGFIETISDTLAVYRNVVEEKLMIQIQKLDLKKK